MVTSKDSNFIYYETATIKTSTFIVNISLCVYTECVWHTIPGNHLVTRCSSTTVLLFGSFFLKDNCGYFAGFLTFYDNMRSNKQLMLSLPVYRDNVKFIALFLRFYDFLLFFRYTFFKTWVVCFRISSEFSREHIWYSYHPRNGA